MDKAEYVFYKLAQSAQNSSAPSIIKNTSKLNNPALFLPDMQQDTTLLQGGLGNPASLQNKDKFFPINEYKSDLHIPKMKSNDSVSSQRKGKMFDDIDENDPVIQRERWKYQHGEPRSSSTQGVKPFENLSTY